MDWQEVAGNWVLTPPRPIAIVHFLGGAFVATAPHVTYRRLLERLAKAGYAIVATPFINTFDHTAIARTVERNFSRAVVYLEDRYPSRYLPIYGIGHSMGCKLHLLIGSQTAIERAGNILMSFNNFAAREAVPLMEQLTSWVTQVSPDFAVEFTPSPIETNRIVADQYQVRRNLLIRFQNDTIDQTRGLADLLRGRFPEMVVAQTLSGNHLTPLGPDVSWKTGAIFTPLDAIGQWMRQEVYRELETLERSILRWLNPLEVS